MIKPEPDNSLAIVLQDDGHGHDRVVVSLQAHGYALDLSPHQARVLATELIMAVNRAEVRNTLRHSQSCRTRHAASGADAQFVRPGSGEIDFKAGRFRPDHG